MSDIRRGITMNWYQKINNLNYKAIAEINKELED